MPTITITMMEGYGLSPGIRGLCTDRAAWMSSNIARGFLYYPVDLRTIYDDMESLQTYPDWMAALASANVNLVRIRLTGRTADAAGGANTVYGFEPMPYGTYNIWHSALDDSNLSTFRSDQVTYPVAGETLANSNLYQLIAAAEENDVGLWVTLFEDKEFRTAWENHAWNSGNEYLNGNTCEVQDRGMVANAYEIFTDADCIQAAQDRIQFVLDQFGSSSAIKVWEIGNEMTYLTNYDLWGETSWNAAMIANVRDNMVPWFSMIANYIRDNDPYLRPIASSNIFLPASGIWPEDPDSYYNVVNEIHRVYPIEIPVGRWYWDGNITTAITHLRAIQEGFPGQTVAIGEYWPFEHGVDPADENPPFLDSKEHQWVATCGGAYGFGAMRWPGIQESAINVWISGGYADSDMHDIAGITNTFLGYVDWENWTCDDHDWYESVTADPATNYTMAWGEGTHVVMMLDFSTGGVKTIGVEDLTSDEEYTLYIFDWEDGTFDSSQTDTASGGTVSFDYDVQFERYIFVAYLRPTP